MQAGTRHEVAAAPAIRRGEQAVERTVDEEPADDGRQRHGQRKSGGDQQQAVAIRLRHRGEGDIRIQSHGNAQPGWLDANRLIGDQPRQTVAVPEIANPERVSCQGRQQGGGQFAADGVLPGGKARQHGAMAVADGNRGTRWQCQGLQLLSQPDKAERHLDHARDSPVRILVRPGHAQACHAGAAATFIVADDEAALLQSKAEIAAIGQVDGGIDGTRRAEDVPVRPTTAAPA